MNKTGLGKLNDSMPKIKRTFHEELNLKLKDTFVSPAVGLKYSHEKLMDRYVRETLASREDRNKEILDKIKDRARPIDHDLLNRHELEYLALSLKERQAREEKTKQRVSEVVTARRRRSGRPSSTGPRVRPTCASVRPSTS
jgi:hypothetical protein